MNKKILGNRIKSLRKTHNLTQKELGAIVGISGGAINEWERGNSMPNIIKIHQISEALNIPISWAFDEKMIELIYTKEELLILTNNINVSNIEFLKLFNQANENKQQVILTLLKPNNDTQ